ncbi:Glucan endo-1,3-beta-glucosidase btgC [Actinidia chinensis var. chinensis]|uniref:Glucan endo-1,3-beta-glucosidase btgC n=1 Tax=Actinidia chinensis var. chinensis TaxID=1590841 RepID=A0A2R6QJ55_ACTCC|nr:Glucan endo-1,3-beta-glucosidase btgC [Actinidia chinensis var. chinensis]
MATTYLCPSLSSHSLSSILNPKPRNSLSIHISSLSLTSPLPLSSRRRAIPFQNPHEIPLKTAQIWRISAVSTDALPSEANPPQIVSSGDDGVSNIISVLLFVAFVGLSILTIGVMYIAVTDFLQKREREKFEKEETSKKKKDVKKRKVRARTGPRGFGQKIEEELDD